MDGSTMDLGWQRGHCGTTVRWSERADSFCCETNGYLRVPAVYHQSADDAKRWCVQQCTEVCTRCSYLSYSQVYQECSWYAACNMSTLTPLRDFQTLEVVPPKPLMTRAMCQEQADRSESITALSEDTLNRSLPALGAASGWRLLFERLDAGRPMTLGIFGASVAQHAGCLTQPGKRCMDAPRGFAVQFLKYINASWPHAKHGISNAGADATVLGDSECLFSHNAFTPLDVVIVEFGSMAPFAKLRDVERFVRTLLSMRMPPPVVIILSVSDWCKGSLSGTDPWAKVAGEELAVCHAYELTCVSPRTAFQPLVEAQEPGFQIGDLAGRRLAISTWERRGPSRYGLDFVSSPHDCLHLVKSRNHRGIKLVAKLLIHAFEKGRERARHLLGMTMKEHTGRRALRPSALPPCLHPVNAKISRPTSCYRLYAPGSVYAARYARLEWKTGWCPEATDAYACVTWLPNASTHCPRKDVARGPYTRFLKQPPRTWLWCSLSLNPQVEARKASEGVVALMADAVLDLLLPVHAAASDRDCHRKAELEYLTSYEGMGISDVQCLGSCECRAHSVDATSRSSLLNSSVWAKHAWNIDFCSGQHGELSCVVRLRVSHASSSQGHKFKIRSVILR